MEFGKYISEICLAIIFLSVALEARSVYKTDRKERLSLLQHEIPVEHFATHGLCRHLSGQQYFQKAMKTKMTSVTEFLVENFVAQLCAAKGLLLEMWVKELFDSDGNGKLNHFEIHFYKPNA